MVNAIIDGSGFDYDADMNGDGSVNVVDVVALVYQIFAPSTRIADAHIATVMALDHSLTISANGYIGGVQMTLSHDSDFEIELLEDAMIAEYNTVGSTTRLVIIEPNDELLFTTNKSFDIIDIIVANSYQEINVDIVSEFELSAAYPNPFNPSTTVSLTVPSADYVSVKVYNLMGQVVGVLADGMMEANVYSFTWDASNMSSGVYLVKAESSSSVDIQKVMLVK